MQMALQTRNRRSARPGARSCPSEWRGRILAVGAIGATVVLASPHAFASAASAPTASALLWTGLLLLLGKSASLVERIGQPAVLGELLVGVFLANLHLLGVPAIKEIATEVVHSEVMRFLAELGVVILLFQVGLESSVGAMRRVGLPALAVATLGVVVPFVLGSYLVGPWMLPTLSPNGHLFLGATLTATSVGITGRVFQDLRVLDSREAQIVLGAAVIDDVLGLIILAVVAAVVSSGSVDLSTIAVIGAKAMAFLVWALLMGQYAASHLSALFSAISAGAGMKVAVMVATCLTFAWVAAVLGLAPIIGAFAAGLVLEEVHFKSFREPQLVCDLRSATHMLGDEAQRGIENVLDAHRRHSLQEVMAPVGHLLVPLFFVYTGMQVDLATLADPVIIAAGLGITVVAFAGKVVTGLVAGPVRRWIVGWGMAPRGEVGLVFAATGKSLGVIPESVFAMIVLVVLLTTLLTPPILTAAIRRASMSRPDRPDSSDC